ncbi:MULTISPECIES: bestrophin family protein [Flavobacterium]|jgi:putative membrane protein|uniref:Membrane protein n=3 Tax=Flavobacterium TaxID=237 RepID=A0ABR6QE88_9FLAO|nr:MULTISPECIES: bestrophin family ion channel [Flavobacterium]MBB4802574.1 putative membrane protein [Flavobacterium nitrogenifigens]MBB6387532.1 putative membrane protein [Flavobacterium notoginsengisoli]MBZ4040890.1 hypothetical protein [Flavobacterium hibisci]MCR4029549.1 hypothetical protein [Flavobacterium panacis]RED26951.1 putative membrane protein [Flavobacterium cutihirudinis]
MLLDKKISVIYFLKQIKSQIILIVVFAVAIGLLDMMPVFKEIALPLSIPALVGTVVSLLLAFRTAQSYERWWEARTVWGAIVNDSRTLIRQVTQFTSKDNKQIADQFTERQIIWVYALGEALRRKPFSPKVLTYLNFHKINGGNIPNALLDKHSDDIALLEQKGIISDFKQVQLNETLARLCDSMGKCERIKNTVFPKSYSLLVHTLIYVFAAILPFGLEDSQLAVEVLITILIPLLFISIEKTAIIMQDPFENTPVDTPMTSLAQTIEINLLEMTGAQEIPVKPKNNEYFEM